MICITGTFWGRSSCRNCKNDPLPREYTTKCSITLSFYIPTHYCSFFDLVVVVVCVASSSSLLPTFSSLSLLLSFLFLTCVKAKMTKKAPGPNSTKRAIHHGQGLSVDFSFSSVNSKNKNCRKDFAGINGETCWMLITDHHTGMQDSKTCCSKASSTEWLRNWLHIHSPNLKDKYVVMDQGGELYSNPDIVNVFTKYQYKVHPTGTDSSHQNGPVKQAHCVIGDHVLALLIGASLDIKFWPYAFFHHLHVQNAMVMKGQSTSCIFQATGMKEDF